MRSGVPQQKGASRSATEKAYAQQHRREAAAMRSEYRSRKEPSRSATEKAYAQQHRPHTAKSKNFF